MSIVLNLILVAQILAAVVMIALILLQHGKGADMGASFGSGASGSLFGATGSANFLSRSTAVAATVFLLCTLALSYLGTRPAGSDAGVMGDLSRAAAPQQGAASSAAKSAVPTALPPASQAGLAQIPAGAAPAAAPSAGSSQAAPGAKR